MKTFRQGDAELVALRTLDRRSDSDAYKSIFIQFALGKALEDIGDYERSFHHWMRGNRLKRSRIDYDERGTVEMFRHSAGGSFGAESDPSVVPIFVVGMPRSGTSLIEQILASHAQIQGAGELQDLCRVRVGRKWTDSPRAICHGFRRWLGVRSGLSTSSRITFSGLALIRTILPNARIIHCVRNPIDTCVSCYSKLFTAGQHFSYDLAELGRYYRRYSDLMAHWRSVLPADAMLDVAYEDVVDDLEGQARRLIDYCGLEWDDRCLSFHKTRRIVKTASAVQVRKPLFRTSLERWRRYEAHLGPLLHALGEYPAASDPSGVNRLAYQQQVGGC